MNFKLLGEDTSLSFPLPLYMSVAIAEAKSESMTFSIFAGFDETIIAQLKEHSLDKSDEEIQKNTSDRKRFGEGSYEKWYAKNRTPFALVDKAGILAAVVWFGPKPLGRKSMSFLTKEEQAQDERSLDSGDWHTLSYRSYMPYRGKGLMKDFVSYVTEIYLKNFPGAKLWGIVDGANASSVALAEKLGYELDEDASDYTMNKLVMIKK